LGAVQQASMLGGILLAQHVEGAVEGREPTSLSEQLGQGLATLLVFNASGLLARRLYGSRMASLERELEIRTRSLGRGFQPEPAPIAAAREVLQRIPAEDLAPVIQLHVPAP